MMDCSDGLATDLGHICRESGVGARVRLDRLPGRRAGAEAAARRSGATRATWAVGGGEDYELLLTLRPGRGRAPRARASRRRTGTPLTVIGRIERDRREHRRSWTPTARRSRCAGGYEHFRG